MPAKIGKLFGITVLDDRLKGLPDAGLNVLVGGPGTGKSVTSLQFLREGLRRSERVAMLTPDRPEDVVELGRSIGIDLAPHIQSGRCVLLGFQAGFRERYRRVPDPKAAFEELVSFLRSEGQLGRLVLDSCRPLVESRDLGIGGDLLVEALSELATTSLVTFTAETPGSLDAAFDPIFQEATLVLQLELQKAGRRQYLVRKSPRALDSSGPISFEVREGAGVVPPSPSTMQRSGDISAETRRRILLLDLSSSLPEEMRLWFNESFELHFTKDPVDAFPELTRVEFGLVVVNVDRHSVLRGLHVMRQLRRAASRPPIMVMCDYAVRATDRAWALKAGADDFISGGLNPEELAWRIAALLRRGRVEFALPGEDEDTPVPDDMIAAKPEELRDLVRSQLSMPGGSIFSVLVLRPGAGQALESLADHVVHRMRRNSGDRLTVMDDHVKVYLRGAMASHAERFLKRVRVEGWDMVAYEVYTSPTDRGRLLDVLERTHV